MADRVHDTVIVGGGTAGCVLAARLSEDPSRRVLLIEAGPAYPPDAYPADLTGPAIAIEPRRTWGYLSEPGRTGHAIAAHAGKVLGGGSAINAGIARRGRPGDFAEWAGHGLPEWTFEQVLPAYKRLEQSDIADPRWHGSTGPWPIRQPAAATLTPAVRAFVDAAASTGLPWIDDFNGAHQHGVGCEVKNIVDGFRTNAGTAYLTAAARARPNLSIRGDVMVDRVAIEGGRAVGVVTVDGETIPAGEVIVSAGVYGSPAVLLRSGIGPAVHLGGLGIAVNADLPVGEGLQDQPLYTVAYRVANDVPDQPRGGSGVMWTRSSLAGRRARSPALRLRPARPGRRGRADPHTARLGLRGQATRQRHRAAEEPRPVRDAAHRLSPARRPRRPTAVGGVGAAGSTRHGAFAGRVHGGRRTRRQRHGGPA